MYAFNGNIENSLDNSGFILATTCNLWFHYVLLLWTTLDVHYYYFYFFSFCIFQDEPTSRANVKKDSLLGLTHHEWHSSYLIPINVGFKVCRLQKGLSDFPRIIYACHPLHITDLRPMWNSIFISFFILHFWNAKSEPQIIIISFIPYTIVLLFQIN